MDIWSKAKRSDVMAKIRGKNTKPELIIRSALFRMGYRYRLHKANLPGKPDIVLPKHKTAIFVHGCFWHFHRDCREGRIPSSNSAFWKNKLEKNIDRDQRNIEKLKNNGWKVVTIWECEIEDNLEKSLTTILSNLCA